MRKKPPRTAVAILDSKFLCLCGFFLFTPLCYCSPKTCMVIITSVHMSVSPAAGGWPVRALWQLGQTLGGRVMFKAS